jgi:hypothetical protein
LLDILGVMVLPIDDDEVLESPADEQVTIMDEPEISGAAVWTLVTKKDPERPVALRF